MQAQIGRGIVKKHTGRDGKRVQEERRGREMKETRKRKKKLVKQKWTEGIV